MAHVGDGWMCRRCEAWVWRSEVPHKHSDNLAAMADPLYEVEVRTRDAAGAESVVHAEYETKATNPLNAARELLDFGVKAVGNDKLREIDPNI